MPENSTKTKERSERNKTIALSDAETALLQSRLLKISQPVSAADLTNKTLHHDLFEILDHLPEKFVDLLFIDPPYNLNKQFNSNSFKAMKDDDYEDWLDSWFSKLLKTLKPTASVYLCGDWKSSGALYSVLSKYLNVRNRITWEREKGRGALSNWKNASEDIWFATVSDDYYFNPDSVKLKKKVIAPYKDTSGQPKDWAEETDGNYRLTFPSNLWTDLTIPFWSMPENTDHPTQKPEKLLAKILLASSQEGDFIFDPFLGSGTTSVVAAKLGRKYCGIEVDETFACLTEKRLEMARTNAKIQGYADGVFWERNSLSDQKVSPIKNQSLFSI